MPPVNVSSISSSIQASQFQTDGPGRHGGGGPLEAAAKALGLSQSDPIDQLKKAKNLDDVASAQGVLHDDLAAVL